MIHKSYNEDYKIIIKIEGKFVYWNKIMQIAYKLVGMGDILNFITECKTLKCRIHKRTLYLIFEEIPQENH